MNRILEFMNSPNKKEIIGYEAGKIMRQLFLKRKFHTYDRSSVIKWPVSLTNGAKIDVGGGNLILSNAQLEAIDSWEGKVLNPSFVIGSGIYIGQNFHGVCANHLHICDNVTISDNVFISDCEHAYQKRGVHVLKQELLVSETVIGENSFIGFGAVIQAGAKLGRQCIVGSNSVVMKGNYPDCCVLAGAPARIVKQYCRQSGEWERTSKCL